MTSQYIVLCRKNSDMPCIINTVFCTLQSNSVTFFNAHMYFVEYVAYYKTFTARLVSVFLSEVN